jgi:hypothetical protein
LDEIIEDQMAAARSTATSISSRPTTLRTAATGTIDGIF